MAKSSNETGSTTVEAVGGEVSGFAKITLPNSTITAMYGAKGEGAMINVNGDKLTLDEKTTREVVDAIKTITANGPLVDQNMDALSNLLLDLRDNAKLDKSSSLDKPAGGRGGR